MNFFDSTILFLFYGMVVVLLMGFDIWIVTRVYLYLWDNIMIMITKSREEKVDTTA